MTRAATDPRGSNRAPQDPYGLSAVGGYLAPALALVGLLIVGWATLSLMTGNVSLPGGGGGGDNNGGGGGAGRTAAPSNVVVVDPRADVPGTMVYAKGGNVWIQSGTDVRQVTNTGTASQPSWSPDGQWILYVETEEAVGLFPAQGVDRRYSMEVPTLMRIRSDGTGEPEALESGLIETGPYTWFHWIRQPVLAPDGRTVALISDQPDPRQSNMVVQLLDLETGEYRRPDVPEDPPLGHQDPAWRPDGRLLLLVRNGKAATGARGAPSIVRWNPESGRTSALTGPGYLSPAWSRDLRWVAATRSTSIGTDITILDARNGAEVFRVTDDGRSFAPVWSPEGDAVAFLHEDGGIVDLRMAKLDGTAPTWQLGETINLTEVSGLDATSRPGWFIPEEDLPPLPTARPTDTPASTGAGSASPG